MRSLRQTDRSGDSGQSLIETALMLLIVFTVVFWIIELSGMMFTVVTIADAAEDGARFGMVQSGVVANDSRIITVVQNAAAISGHDVRAISVAVSLPDGSSTPPNRIKVTVSYTYVPWLKNFIINNPFVISAYAEGRMVVQ